MGVGPGIEGLQASYRIGWIQWSLGIKDTLGVELLPFIQRLSLCLKVIAC